jgi:hypothetical protein
VKRNHTMPAKTICQTRPATPTDGLEAEIRERAYELYEQRGGDEGHELDDWLQAETELQRKAKAASV